MENMGPKAKFNLDAQSVKALDSIRQALKDIQALIDDLHMAEREEPLDNFKIYKLHCGIVTAYYMLSGTNMKELYENYRLAKLRRHVAKRAWNCMDSIEVATAISEFGFGYEDSSE